MQDVTFWLRLHAARRARQLAAQDPARAQAATLLGLVQAARNTAFGRAHDFAAIRTVADFQARVPLRRYDEMWRTWWEPAFPRLDGVSWPDPIPFFAESSGTTTGVSKFIPVSRAMLRANARAAHDTFAWHVLCTPGSRLLGGENFMLGGSTGLRTLAPGIRAGDLSGIAAVTMPLLARSRAFPPQHLALIADWDEKLDRLARAALTRDIRSISGTPSWLLLLFERLAALHPARPDSLAPVFPNLEMILHGGVGFAPYRAAFARWMAGTRATTREVFAASEGFVAAADTTPEAGLRVFTDNGLFLEFADPETLTTPHPTRHWLATAETGRDYALILSSNAGLFAYVIGDRVRLLSRDPPRLIVTGRLAHELSLFGEHVTGAELDAAVTRAATDAGLSLADYTSAAILAGDGSGRGHHAFVLETEAPGAAVEPLARAIDRALAAGNADYATHRAGDVQLQPPVVRLVPPGTFAAWMRARGRLGGQNKVPRVVTAETLAVIAGTSPMV